MHLIEFESNRFHLPESWNELTTDQLYYLVRLTVKDTPVEEIKTFMMLYCLGAKVARESVLNGGQYRLLIKNRKYLVSPEDIVILSSLFEFLLESVESKEGTPRFVISPERTMNPFPVLHCQNLDFYGPEDGLCDISYEQFVWLQHYHQAMQTTPEAVDFLLAILYHRKREFDINQVEADSRVLRHLPQEQKMILFWFYLSSLRWIANNYPRVFSGNGKTSENVYESQLRIIDSLAGSDMTKKPAVRKGLLFDALVSMEESIRKQEEMESKNPAHS